MSGFCCFNLSTSNCSGKLSDFCLRLYTCCHQSFAYCCCDVYYDSKSIPLLGPTFFQEESGANAIQVNDSSPSLHNSITDKRTSSKGNHASLLQCTDISVSTGSPIDSGSMSKLHEFNKKNFQRLSSQVNSGGICLSNPANRITATKQQQAEHMNVIHTWAERMDQYIDFESKLIIENKSILTDAAVAKVKENAMHYLSTDQPECIKLLACKCKEFQDYQSSVLKAVDNSSSSSSNSSSNDNNSNRISMSGSVVKQEKSRDHGHSSTIRTSDAISETWAKHLSTLVPSQGGIDINIENPVMLQISPKWPEWLQHETFEVTKVNKFGHQYDRILILTQNHILSCKLGELPSKAYEYLDVEKLNLGIDSKSLTITFKSDKRKFHYITTFAAHISQQIVTRIKVTFALSKSSYSINVPTIGYTKEALLSIIDAIDDENAKAGSNNLMLFALSLKNRVLPAADVRLEDGVRPQNPDLGKCVNNSNTGCPASKVDEAAKFTCTFEQGSGEYRVQELVRRLLYSMKTPEGNTRLNFIATFEGKDLLDLRQWIEGMHEYIFLKRCLLLVKAFNNEIPTDDATLATTPGTSTDSNSSNDVIDSIDINSIDEDILVAVSFIIFTVVEESMFFHLSKAIMGILHPPDLKLQDELLSVKIQGLAVKTQEEWGIPEENRSHLGWNSAIFELEGVERNPVPSSRLNAIVRSIKAIFAEFHKEVLPRLEKIGKKDVALGADDIVPIFIYVLCRSGLKHPLLNKNLLWALVHPDQLYGESGYYLTIYESAVTYISQQE